MHFIEYPHALTMGLLAGVPPVGISAILGAGGAMAKALSMGSLGAGAFSVSIGFFILALCLALTLLIYAARYFFNRRNSRSHCVSLDAWLCKRGFARSHQAVSSIELTPVSSIPSSSTPSLGSASLSRRGSRISSQKTTDSSIE